MNRLIHISAYLMLCIALFPLSTANAQIKGTAPDAKFANTTVVYKDSTASDARILAQFEKSMGVGDVIRITAAPPRPAVKPATPITIETPAFDRPKPAVDVPTLTASSGQFDLSNVKPTSVETPGPLLTTEIPVEKKPSVQTETVKTARKQVAVTHKAVKKTGKIYKHNKRKRKFSLRLFDGPIFKKQSKSKYGCYKF